MYTGCKDNKKIPLAKAILRKCDKEQQTPWNFVFFHQVSLKFCKKVVPLQPKRTDYEVIT